MTSALTTGLGKAPAAILGTVALVAGCSPPATNQPAPAQSPEPSSAVAGSLKGAMPTRADFPDDWEVRLQDSRPVALPGLAEASLSAVSPQDCAQFANEFVSAPGSSIPGDFVSSAIAMIPNSAGAFDQSSVVFFATEEAGGTAGLGAVRGSLLSCAQVSAQMRMQGQSMPVSFSSAPLDVGEIAGAAEGRTTTIRASEALIHMATVRATVKGVLVSASSMIVSGSGEDQRAVLLRLVARTVDRLNAM